MARPRKIDRFPELREALAREREKGATLDDLTGFVNDWLADAGEPGVARSSVASWLARVDAVAEHVRRTREAAEVMVSRWGDGGDRLVVRAAIETLQATLMNLSMDQDIDLDQARAAARAIHHLAMAERASVDVIERERRAAGKAAEAAAKSTGASQDTIAAIRAAIRGPGTRTGPQGPHE